MSIKLEVHFFRPSGKWYTSEEIDFPEDTKAWTARRVIEEQLKGRLSGMSAVVLPGDALWGFPTMCVDLGGKGPPTVYS